MNVADPTIITLAVETVTIVGSVATVVYKLGRAVEKFEAIGRQQASEIKDLKDSVRTISDVITKVAVQKQRMDSIEERLTRQDRMIDELRHGAGFIGAASPAE